ncbi:hypothetical protein [Streptosporangium subroseum]|uniref:hypothetical protein n=1 Tax=Streptosporangium subroseum TaxID=106412 RepID=UPI00308B5A11|nr:hypothetical protein OHB15_40450 [Streptosporangium subroseum]
MTVFVGRLCALEPELSGSGVSIDEISRLVGHSGTAVTEPVYRKQIRPILQSGAAAMDRIFKT